jgi:hypothetical protein
MSMVDAGISQVLDGIWGSALPRCDRRFLCGQAVAASRLGGDGRVGVPADHCGEGVGVLQLFEGLMLQARSVVGRPIGLGQVRGLLLAAGRRDLVSRLTEVNRARRAIAHPDVGLAGLVRDALAAAVLLHSVGDDIDEVGCDFLPVAAGLGVPLGPSASFSGSDFGGPAAAFAGSLAEIVAQETKHCFEGEALCDLVYEPSDVSHGAGRVGCGSWCAGGHAAAAAATTGIDEAAAATTTELLMSGSLAGSVAEIVADEQTCVCGVEALLDLVCEPNEVSYSEGRVAGEMKAAVQQAAVIVAAQVKKDAEHLAAVTKVLARVGGDCPFPLFEELVAEEVTAEHRRMMYDG